MRTEYGDLLRNSPDSVRVQENTDQKKLRIWTLFHAVKLVLLDYWIRSILPRQIF